MREHSQSKPVGPNSLRSLATFPLSTWRRNFHATPTKIDFAGGEGYATPSWRASSFRCRLVAAPTSVGAGCSTRVCKHFKLVFRCAAVDCSTARFRGLPRLRLIVRSQMPLFLFLSALANPLPRAIHSRRRPLRMVSSLQRIRAYRAGHRVPTLQWHRVTPRPFYCQLAPPLVPRRLVTLRNSERFERIAN